LLSFFHLKIYLSKIIPACHLPADRQGGQGRQVFSPAVAVLQFGKAEIQFLF